MAALGQDRRPRVAAGSGDPRAAASAAPRGSAEPAPRGRPRSVKAHEAILEAAAGLLLEHGLDAVSMDAVAMRAGVSKATIYRWWPTKESLALDAMSTSWIAAVPAPKDTGTLHG